MVERRNSASKITKVSSSVEKGGGRDSLLFCMEQLGGFLCCLGARGERVGPRLSNAVKVLYFMR